MTNDELSEIDQALARAARAGHEYPLTFDQCETLRDQLAENAARAVTREKRLADLERENGALREQVGEVAPDGVSLYRKQASLYRYAQKKCEEMEREVAELREYKSMYEGLCKRSASQQSSPAASSACSWR